ncbi:hypothetical protein LJR153_007116 [Paenibacillus sp. LjRoot153]
MFKLLPKLLKEEIEAKALQTSGAVEVIAQINEKAIRHLEAPVLCIAPLDTIYPFAQIEEVWLPSQASVIAGINQLAEF